VIRGEKIGRGVTLSVENGLALIAVVALAVAVAAGVIAGWPRRKGVARGEAVAAGGAVCNGLAMAAGDGRAKRVAVGACTAEVAATLGRGVIVDLAIGEAAGL
jgi:hypothetical protein